MTIVNKLIVLLATRGKLLRSLALIGIIMVGTPTTALAVPILDQFFDAFAGGSNTATNVQSNQTAAQTFTVGLMGLLSQIDMQFRTSTTPDSNATLSILSTSGGGLLLILGT